MIFFGTPHGGSKIASFATLLLSMGSAFAKTNTSLIKHLRADSGILKMQLQQFDQISDDFNIITFYETFKENILLGRGVLVGSEIHDGPSSVERALV